MALLKTCCCWNNVRSGSIACGVYTMILALINTGIIAFNLNFLNNHLDHLDRYFQDTHNFLVATMVACVSLLLSSVTLILGVHLNRQYLLLPWIGTMFVMIVMDTAALVYECLSFGLLTFNVIQMVVWLGLSLLNIYCMMCVVSQYQELRAGRGTAQHNPRMHRILYSSTIEEVHITDGPITLTLPRGTIVTSSVTTSSVTTVPNGTAMQPPDYAVAAMALPHYGPAGPLPTGATNKANQADPLLGKTELETPPPPYSP